MKLRWAEGFGFAFAGRDHTGRGDLLLGLAGHLGLLSRRRLGLLARLGFERLLRRPQLLQAALTPGELGGDLVAPAVLAIGLVLGLVDRFCLGEHRVNLGLQLFDPRHDVVIAHRLVARGVGDELGAVKSDAPESHEPCFRGQAEHLEEERPERVEVAAAKAADRAAVGRLVRCQPSKGDVALAAALDLARGGDPGRVAVEQQLQHHSRLIGRGARGGLIGGVDRGEVEEVLHYFGDKARLVVLVEPVIERGWQQEALTLVVAAKGLRLADRSRLRAFRLAHLHFEELITGEHKGHETMFTATNGSVVDSDPGS